MRIPLLTVLGLLVVLAGAAAAQSANEGRRAFYRGNDLFESGDFAGAVGAYRTALDAGQTSAALHFNLGNAHLRLGQPGHAIHQFRLAERLAPRDGDIAANLRVAHERAGLAPPARREGILRALLYAHDELTRGEALLAFTLLWFGGFTLLHLRLLLRWPRGLLVPGLLLVFGAALLASVLMRHPALQPRTAAIVVAPTASAWSGRSEESFGKLFELPEGEEVEVLEEDGDWFKIAAGDRKGYVRAAQLRRL